MQRNHFSLLLILWWQYDKLHLANDSLPEKKIAEVWRECHEKFATLITLSALCTSLYFDSLAKAKVKKSVYCEL